MKFNEITLKKTLYNCYVLAYDISILVPGNKKSDEENSKFLESLRENRPYYGAESGLTGKKSKTISE